MIQVFYVWGASILFVTDKYIGSDKQSRFEVVSKYYHVALLCYTSKTLSILRYSVIDKLLMRSVQPSNEFRCPQSEMR